MNPADRLATLLQPAGPRPTPTNCAGPDMARPEPARPATPASLTAPLPSITLAPGDLVVARIDSRPRLCAVQRIRRADHIAIVRPLDELDRYWRVPAADLILCAPHTILTDTYRAAL